MSGLTHILVGETLQERLERDGCSVVPLLEEFEVEFWRKNFDFLKVGANFKHRGDSAFGIRNLLNVVPEARDLTEIPYIRHLVEGYAGKNARVVRGIYFDKTPEANWKVPLHQDLTIAVRERIETEGFTAWTMKAGVQHVQPPVSIMEKMLTVRIHLDDTDETNGTLRLVPGSHNYGRLSAEQIQQLKAEKGFRLHQIDAGGALLMRPLLLHASSASAKPQRRRRVIHLEFSAEKLPNGLEWYGS